MRTAHRRGTLATAVATALLVAPPADAAGPELESVAVYRAGEGGYHTYRIPSLLVAPGGTLLAFAEGRKGGAGDAGDIDLVFRRSSDGGKTWSPAQVVWDDGPNTCGNPCPVVDAGTIHLLMTRNLGIDREPDIIAGRSKDTRRVFVAESRDGGKSWSNPREITDSVKPPGWTWYATGPGAGIRLTRGPHPGRLVVACDHIESGRYYSHAIYSDDRGKTWRLGGTAPEDGVNESEVVELSDGRLMLNMRNHDRSRPGRRTAISGDGGATWGEPKVVAELVEPVCQASFRRLSWPEGDRPGAILFSNPASTRRERLTVRASFDDGRTWPVSRLVDPRPGAYSCLAALPDGSAGLLYEAGDRRPYEAVLFARFPLSWLAPGRSPAAK